jgi:phosphodiesterase/alkaline phosphatase D-like protein
VLSMVFNNGNYASKANFMWSTDPYFMGATYVPPEAVAASTSNVTAKVQLTGLKPNTTYYYRAAAVTPLGSAESVVQSFKTAPM